MKRTFFICTSILIALILATGIFAGNQPNTKDGKGAALTMFCAETSPNYDQGKSDIAQKMKEITGVDLQLEFTIGEAQQKITVMLASGDYPDMVFAKGDVSKFVEAEALLDLTPLIDKYGPNIKSFYGQYLKRARFSVQDPSMYWIGCFGVDDVVLEPGNGFQVQLAVLKELGYPKLKSVTDFENALKTYYQKYPTINGKPTIPYTLCAEGWRILISITNTAVFATGGNGDDGEYYVDLKTHKAVIHHTRPEEKEYFRWLNHMYNTGLLDPEFATQKYDTYVEKIVSGRVLGLSSTWWEYNSAEDQLRKSGMPERTYGVFPVTLDGKTDFKSFMGGGYVPNWGVSITKSCKDPVRAIKYLDWMCTDEAQILRYWGVEGKHYEIKDGKRVETEANAAMRKTDPDYMKKTGMGSYIYPFPAKGSGQLDKTGQIYNPVTSIDYIINEYPDVEKEVLKGYGVKTWKDLFKTDYPVKPWGNAWQLTVPQDHIVKQLEPVIQAINWKRVLESIVCKTGEFDKVWDSYQKELKDAGVDKLNAEMTKLIQERVKFWND